MPNRHSAKGWRMGGIGGSPHLDTATTRDCSHPELCWPRLRWRAQWASQVASTICGQTVHWIAPNCTNFGALVKIRGHFAWEPPNGPQRKVSVTVEFDKRTSKRGDPCGTCRRNRAYSEMCSSGQRLRSCQNMLPHSVFGKYWKCGQRGVGSTID